VSFATDARRCADLTRTDRKRKKKGPNDDYAATRRTADDIISRLMPLKSMFTPTRVPTAQILLAGQLPMIMNAKSSVTMPLNSSHPDPLS
jgi:hypothetical protein